MAVLTSTRQKREAWIEWLDHCRGGRFTNQLFFGKTIGGVPDVWADAIVALEKALQAGGYTPRSAWSYNFRGIAGATCTCSNFGRCSLHGNGIAIDIDPRLNPFVRKDFSWDDTAFTPEQLAFVEGILNTKGEQMWSWGGRWGSVKDYMHFETNVDPGSTDVDWTTVPGDTEGEEPPIEGEEVMLPLQKGDTGEDVTLLQDRLNQTYGAGLNLNATYDDATVAAVKEHLGKYTGNQNWKNGLGVGGNQWSNLVVDLVRRFGGDGSGGVTEDRVNELIAASSIVPE